jgi:hypothetical protein
MGKEKELNVAFQNIFKRRVAKKDAMGIHDLLFYELKPKKVYYPTRRDEEAVNPDGSRLRMLTASGATARLAAVSSTSSVHFESRCNGQRE